MAHDVAPVLTSILTTKRPELLAPVGGWPQFYAAIHAGADAVFLGLKQFNARARAENFTIEDLHVLVPIAHHFGVKVLVTLNVLIKDQELDALVSYLSDLTATGIDAVIVQDFAVAQLVRKFFPQIRLHASTQMAVHNAAGVRALVEHGFRRVVVAREMTAIELKRMNREIEGTGIEVEAFCHGSLCYSYSGLCFFSGANDARSGNRGECAYTCREPYKILNEPGQGFLFSMRDLDTRDLIPQFLAAGIDTLKIEGRKKDAQYVAAVVGTYKARLDALCGPRMDRLYPTVPTDRLPINAEEALTMTFARKSTSFFVSGRYVENVIDLDNPTHRGRLAGSVLEIKNNRIRVTLQEPLQRFDGVRLAPGGAMYRARPQHEESAKQDTSSSLRSRYDNNDLAFSVRSLYRDNRLVAEADSGDSIWLQLPDDNTTKISVGWQLWRTRSNTIKQWSEQMSRLPEGIKAKAWREIDLAFHVAEPTVRVELRQGDTVTAQRTFTLEGWQPSESQHFAAAVEENFAVIGDAGLRVQNLVVHGAEGLHLPRPALKQWKRELGSWLKTELQTQVDAQKLAALQYLRKDFAPLKATGPANFSLKSDDVATLRAALSEARIQGLPVSEIIFEPKRNRLPLANPETWLNELEQLSLEHSVSLRLAFPLVIRAWDEPLLQKWFQSFHARFGARFDVGNVGCFEYLSKWGLRPRGDEPADLVSDFALYALNREAVVFLANKGLSRATLSIENDLADITSLCKNWPTTVSIEPEVILYKDTPLFIAESCSLTALHNGCPSAKVCGYRTLHIENGKGERFYVAHENCKSIVYAEQAFSLTAQRHKLEALGIRRFRLDFLTRPFTEEAVRAIVNAAAVGQVLPETHSANFEKRLL